MNADKTKRLIRVHLRLSAAYILCLTGCGRYSDFTLPPVSGGDPSLLFRFVAQPDPVLTSDPFKDALNPSIAGNINLYSAYDGQAWHTALALSTDRIHWQKRGIV